MEPTMTKTTKPVQISIDEELLHLIDSDSETQARGRSAFVRNAVRAYLRAKERWLVDDAIRRAYDGAADDLLSEVEEVIGTQAWPEK